MHWLDEGVVNSDCMLQKNALTAQRRLVKRVPLYKGLEEVKILKQINGIIGTPSLLGYEIEGTDMRLFLSYFEGMALDAMPFEIKGFTKVFSSGLSVLERIHEVGIWHRDLCPRHILVDEYSNVCIIDFGAADFKKSSEAIVGTMRYAAPEALFEPTRYSDSSERYAYVNAFYTHFKNDIGNYIPNALDIFAEALALDPQRRPSYEALLHTLNTAALR